MACKSTYILNKNIIEISILLQNTDHEDGTDVLTNDNDALHSADAIVIIRGQKEDDFTYSKTAAIQVCIYPICFFLFIIYPSCQTWLFGYEMHDVLVVFCQDSVIIFAGSKKINYLKQVN